MYQRLFQIGCVYTPVQFISLANSTSLYQTMATPTPSPFTDIQCGGLHRNATTLTTSTTSTTPFIPQTCLVLAPNTLPSYAISVAVTHFVTGGLALLCAVGFVANVAAAKKVMLAMGSKQPTDKISFFVAPLLCCIFCFCSTVHGLSTFPNVWSSTYDSTDGIGKRECCL